MTKLSAIPLLLGLAFAAPVAALAQAPAQPPRAAAPAQGAVDQAARAEAQRIITALNLGNTMDQTMEALRPVLTQQLQQQGRATPQQAEAAMNEVILPALREAKPQMLAGIADIWARHFTAAELRELAAFYDTPLGRKSLAVTPQIAAETQAMTQQIVPRVLNDTIARNRDALRQRGIQL